MSGKKFNVICDLVMVTYDNGPSLSPFVAKVTAEIRKNDKVEHVLTPMGTIIEGDWHDVIELIDHLFTKFASDYERLGLTLKVDFRAGKDKRISGKVESVMDKLNN